MNEQSQVVGSDGALVHSYAVASQQAIKVGNRGYAVAALSRWVEQANSPILGLDREPPTQPMPRPVLAAYSDSLG